MSSASTGAINTFNATTASSHVVVINNTAVSGTFYTTTSYSSILFNTTSTAILSLQSITISVNFNGPTNTGIILLTSSGTTINSTSLSLALTNTWMSCGGNCSFASMCLSCSSSNFNLSSYSVSTSITFPSSYQFTGSFLGTLAGTVLNVSSLNMGSNSLTFNG